MLDYMKQEPQFYKQVALLTIPIVLQNVITSTLAMADSFMVGLLGEVQMAALTLANIPVFVIQLFLFGVQSGASILMSQYWGKQDFNAIQRVLGLSLWLSISVTGVFALICYQFPMEFLGLFGNDPQVVALAASYGKLIGFAFFFNGISLMYVGAHRSMGNPKLGMYILGLSMVVNLFLNWVFIFGNLGAPALGVQGAAVGTFMARLVEFVVVIIHGCTCKTFRPHLKTMIAPGKEILGKFWIYCTPVVLNETGWGLGTSMYTTVMGHMEGSAEILAAMAIASNIERVVMVSGFGIAASTAILIGNAIGAGRPKEKVIEIGYCLTTIGTIIGFFSGFILTALAYTVLPHWVAPTFQLSAESTHIAQIMMVMLAICMAQRTFNTIAVVGIFRGGGDAKKSMLIDLAPLWFVAIPLSVLFGLVLHLHVFWVTVAMASESVVKSFFGLYYLRKKDWVNNVTDTAPQV